ncbi:BglG family transcription antiterminator, partial [Intestinibacter sp.]|uniref:BglG family transcription antiterminator n=1 Tax=Intestinibacter sp. TaxID=1965304 RepID=UPI003F13CE8B
MRNRSTDILYYIMNNHKIAYNVDKLSKKYNVTLKTLQNDIKEINQLLKSLGFSNIEYNEDGNLIIAEDFDVVKIKEYLDEMDFYTYKFSKEERRIFIIFMLIRDENFITMSDIADKFYVSRVTILNDIEVIKEILTKYNIVLQSKRSKGIKLLCNEENLRYMMIDLLRKIVKNITGEGYFQRIILTQLNTKYSVSDVVDLLKKFVKKYKYTYTDYVFYENVIYVYVMINRIDKGCNNVYTNENDSSLSIYTDAFINYLEQEINISINKNEKIIYENYIKENDIVPVLEEIGNTDLFSVLLEFLSSIENNLNIELVSDSILVDSLVQHINSMKDWSEKDLDIDFRVTGSMKREFEEVYKEVEKYAYILENHLRHDLNKQRKESIVVHICASLIRSRTDLSPLDILIVCPGSMATGKLIEAQIRNYYDFNIKGVIAADKLFTQWDFNNDNVDFIISTVNIQNDRY